MEQPKPEAELLRKILASLERIEAMLKPAPVASKYEAYHLTQYGPKRPRSPQM